MTKAQIKAKAKKGLTNVEKIIEEHGSIEEGMANPDDYEEFVSVGMALGHLQESLRELIEA